MRQGTDVMKGLLWEPEQSSLADQFSGDWPAVERKEWREFLRY